MNIQVGILSEENIAFSFNGNYSLLGKVVEQGEELTASIHNGKIYFNEKQFDTLVFEPEDESATFCLKQVTIGVSFHWERKHDQSFQGALKLIPDNGKIIAINIISIEDYLKSVISSEMSATASLEFLKAHAVISRSWLMAQIEKNNALKTEKSSYSTIEETTESYIRWYDREDHLLFDVCADDHCQRYQGISHIISPLAKQSVDETRGEVLIYEDKICDARFSKCCGGISEEFRYVWEPVAHPYLKAVADKAENAAPLPDLTKNENAENWITASPDAFCNTTDKKILSQVLTNFDQETMDFYRWKVNYTQAQLSILIKQKSGFDFGEILDMIPVERGKSGRLVRLKIVGTKRSMVFGKELEIRRILSDSHLYSSAFIIKKTNVKNGIPQEFSLIGAGWGHGVGLCQIGAAVMGEKGYRYDEILKHYFSGASIQKRE